MQDGISRHLAGEYNVFMVVMIRFWFFALFVMALAARKPGGIRAAVRATLSWRCRSRAACFWRSRSASWCVAFVLLGLVESHAVFTCYPLLVAALSGPVLGEKVGWRRWTAIGIGFVGVLIILQPGVRGLFARGPDPAALGLPVRALRPADPLRLARRQRPRSASSGPGPSARWR